MYQYFFLPAQSLSVSFSLTLFLFFWQQNLHVLVECMNTENPQPSVDLVLDMEAWSNGFK